MDKEKIVRENVFRESEETKGIAVRGYDFDDGVDWEKIIESYRSTGAQATNLSTAISIVNKMISEKAFIFLGYTSSMVSSGLRDVFRYLVKHKKINVAVTTAGGIEEDIIKCLGDFVIGDFRADGGELRGKGINRIGNIFAANNRYIEFEKFVQQILQEMLDEKEIWTPSEIIWKLGEKINDESSICYWAFKNKIKIYCPAITDGAFGDNVYFFRLQGKDLKIDIARDAEEFNNTTIGLAKSGLIILGTGIVKHSILNANMLRNGADYAVYVNTASEYDGSDAGALPSEAVSWGKIKENAESVKVFADATIVFPLIVAESFAKN
ncbi:deoxyhypusine synthase [Candidatus Pacearchaeota archaeon]|nr:deoxyhypusine synthase [Candidatus Pacearchaeota archaeon]